MKPERWQQIDELLDAALERAPEERMAFLSAACAGDEELRLEVESLLGAHERAGSFIEFPPAQAAAELLSEQRAEEQIGRRLGRYELLSLLGQGGMGEVYLAQDTRLRRRVALKLLPSQFTQDANRVRRFEQEAIAASALNHPNIITIHDIGQVEETYYIVSEFIEGQTLRKRMAKERINLREALDIAAQIGGALSAAHTAGITHRDIKPENVMARPDGFIKVLDFGLAKLTEPSSPTIAQQASNSASQTTESGVVMGTPRYMSPEQARGLKVDARTDLFSLGTVLYEMVAGRVPFDGATTSDVIVSILEKDPAPLARHRPDMPAELDRIVKKALAKDREERYQLAKDLLTDLKSLRQEQELRTKLDAMGPVNLKGAAQATSELQLSVSTAEQLTTRTGKGAHVNTASDVKGHRRGAILWTTAISVMVAVTAAAFWVIYKSKPPAPNAVVKSIAVLPFKSLLVESRNEALELGMADTLINKLSPLRQLVVRPLSAVRRYTRLEQDPLAAGRELGVDYVLEGNLQMVGEKTRATVRLLSVKDGRAVWTDKCDQQCSTIFELQDTIAGQIAGTLALALTGGERKQLAKHYTENPEAYRLYNLGAYHLGNATKEGIEKGIEYFEQAIKLDPNYALAYLGLGSAYGRLGLRGFWPPNEARQKSERAALQAVELDDTLPDAHAALAYIKEYNWDWVGAEREFKLALELDPNSPEANSAYVPFLVDVGQTDEALGYATRADELDQAKSGVLRAYVYFHARQYDKAIELYLKAIEKAPNRAHAQVRFFLGEAYLAKRMYEQGIAELQRAIDRNNAPERWDRWPMLAYAYAVSGRRDEALKILDEQKKLAQHSYISPYNFAIIYTGLGDKDGAFEWLEKAYQDRSEALSHFKSRPIFDSLRSDRRYPALLRKMNLAP